MSRNTHKVNTSRFYQEWKGHQIADLQTFHDIVTVQCPNKAIIYLAGDSSLDNKFWVPGTGAGGEELPVKVPKIYHQILNRPLPKPDVAFWMNHLLGNGAACINAAIEESMLRDRDFTLLPQDIFIRDHIRKDDILIVSIGANDIALNPSLPTIAHMACLAWLTSKSSIESGKAWALPYFIDMFGAKTQKYIEQVTAVTKPRAVMVCMIYFPLEFRHQQQSWAKVQLKALGYRCWPGQLQTAIRKMFELATAKINIEGTLIIPCPLYKVLDGTEAADYTARVEPSRDGGRKMAALFCNLLAETLRQPKFF